MLRKHGNNGNGKQEATMLNKFKNSVAAFRQHNKGAITMMAAAYGAGMVALTGMTVDLSHMWAAKTALQNSTDAAALSAADVIFGSTSVTQAQLQSAATTYSATSTGNNSNSNLTSVTLTVTPTCFSSTSLTCGTTYTPTTGAPSTINGVTVTQTATVNLYFGGIIGMSTKTITANAAAQSQQGIATTTHTTTINPLDTVIIIDATKSMGDAETCAMPSTSNSNVKGTTKINCALGGVQALLATLNPCDATLGCGTVTNGVATNPQSQVALMAFPPMSTAYDATGTTQQSYDYDCSSSNSPSTVAYNDSSVYSGASTSWSATASYKHYMVLPFQSDYRSSNAATTLSATSNLAKAVGGSSTCSSAMSAPGGQGSYAADAIRAAANYLANNGRTGSTKAIILFSDGGFTAVSSKSPNTNYGTAATSTNGSMASSQCQAALAAALNAKNAGITVYTLAYESSTGTTSSDCADSAALAKGTGTSSTAWSTNTSPCNVMRYIASSDSDFYSYYSSGSTGYCSNPSVSANNLASGATTTAFTSAFTGMASSMNSSTTTQTNNTVTRPRLLKWGTT